MGLVESQPSPGDENLGHRDPQVRLRKDTNSDLESRHSTTRSLAGRAARVPYSWAVAGAELVATTTADVAITTMSAAMKTASVLASTTEAMGNVVASTTTNVALNTANVATQTANLITTATSVGAKTAGEAIVGTATMVVEGLAAPTTVSPKHISRENRTRSRSGDSTTPLSPGSRVAFFATAGRPSQDMHLPEAMALGASSSSTQTEPSNVIETKGSMRNVGSRLLSILGATNLSARKHWVATVTSSKPSAPSAKYLRKILALAWATKGKSIHEFYRFLSQRPLTTSSTCALKALITCLRLVREGPPEALFVSIENVGVIDSMGAAWAEKILVDLNPELPPTTSDARPTSPQEFARDELLDQMLIARLSGFLVQKMHFHSRQLDLNSRYERIQAVRSSENTADDEETWELEIQLSSALLTLLGTIEGVVRLALGMGGGLSPAPENPTPAALSLVALLIEEALSAFDALSLSLFEHSKSSQQDASLMRALMSRYQEAYTALRSYCFIALKFPYVVALNKVPQLNDEINPLGSRLSSFPSHVGPTATPNSGNSMKRVNFSGSAPSLASRHFTQRSILETLEEEEALEHRLNRDGKKSSPLQGKSAQKPGGFFQSDEEEEEENLIPKDETNKPITSLLNPWEFSSNSVEHARPPSSFCLETEDDEEECFDFEFEENDEEDDDDGALEKQIRTRTEGNPFDTGNSSVVLLAAAHRSAFSTITNPFASGQFNTFTILSKSQQPKQPLDLARQQDATKRALEQCVRLFEFSGINIDPSQITISKDMIGRGAFSVVYRGTYLPTNEEIAVKEISFEEWGRSAETILDFRAEVAVMKAVHHPNILRLIGACTTPNLRLVSEFCHRGNLFDVLFNDRAAAPLSSKTLTWPLKLKLALGEARGVHFLHTAFPVPLIHRDLKSLNLLLSKNWTLKVSDFGLSRFHRRGVVDGPCGTTQWMAPEVIQGQNYDEKADVYSFGVNLWELASRRVPWEGQSDVKKLVVEGERLTLDPEVLDPKCPESLVELITRCWSENPADRPDFGTIINELKYISGML